MLPLYLYDHSGITMNTTGFHCPWDSGQLGFIYVTRDEILREYGRKRLSKKLVERARRVLVGEVGTYDQYLTGDIYCFGYELTQEIVTCPHCRTTEPQVVAEDSCCGYYGMEYMLSEINDSLKEYGIEVEVKW